MEWELNSEQERAVQHGAGPMLVVAGAGTGKTQVITRRISWLIEQNLAKPESILALTFTDKAAGEMLDRLDALIGWQAYRVNVMTFHAFGAQILQRFGHHHGRHITGEVISKTVKVLLIKQQLPKIELSYWGNDRDLVDLANRTVEYIEALQNADISVESYAKYVESLDPKQHHKLDIAEAEDNLKLYRLYEELKAKHGLIDYYDQIQLPLELLQRRPNILERLQEQFNYVLVDEYQDTNAGQDALLRLLVPPGGNIFAVGDDDQAIYGFRGARLENILAFADHWQVKSPLVLTKNYRSSQEILDAAYRLIRHNDPNRLEVQLGLKKRLSGQFKGSQPHFQAYADSAQEYQVVAQALAERVRQGQLAEALAVLAPSHRLLKAMARALKAIDLPYQITSQLNIFEQPEVLQLWHLLTWIGLGASDETITHVLHGPFIGWSAQQVRPLLDQAKADLIGVEAALEKTSHSNAKAAALVRQLDEWRRLAKELSVGHLAYHLVFESGLGQTWVKAAEESPRMVQVFEDLQLWFRQLQQFEQVTNDQTLAGYLETYPQPPEIEAEEVQGDDQGVRLLTIHAAKGLEFEVVYLIGSTAEAWSDQALGYQVELPPELKPEHQLPPEHERRRLLYVAMTRAKQELIITAPVLQSDGRQRRSNQFISEIFGDEASFELPAQSSDRLTRTLGAIERFAPSTMQWTKERLPFETPDGWLELTTTELSRFDYCPYEFYLEKVLKLQSPFGPQVVFGNLLHQLIHNYYEAKLTKQPLKLADLEKRLDQLWSDRGYRTAQEAELAHQVAKETLEHFFRREEKSKRRLRSSEETIAISIDEAKLRLRGRIDASFETPEGIEIRDFKTGRRREAEKLAEAAKANLQLRTYALAVKEMTGQAPARVVLDYIVTGVEGAAELSPVILKNHRRKLAELAERIRQRQFAPNPDPFHNCASYRYWGSGEDDA